MSHTPGPWVARKTAYTGRASGAFYIYAPNGADQRSPCVAHIKRSTIHPMEANARLIAAAPDLLEALEELVSRCDGEEGVRADGSNIQTYAAHAAIEKARGE